MSASTSHNRPLDVGDVGIAKEDLPHFESGAIDLAAWFPADRRPLPLELEIGSGKGTFLVQQAQTDSGRSVNYIGLEYARAFWRYAADRVRRRQLDNVRLVNAEAAFFLRNYVGDGVFHRVHIYFPDPWPKKRQNKRRLVQADFLRDLHRVLAPAGEVRLATDHADYFQWMGEHAVEVEDLFEPLPFEKPQSASSGELVGTNFERKYRREGRPFFAMILGRRT